MLIASLAGWLVTTPKLASLPSSPWAWGSVQEPWNPSEGACRRWGHGRPVWGGTVKAHTSLLTLCSPYSLPEPLPAVQEMSVQHDAGGILLVPVTSQGSQGPASQPAALSSLPLHGLGCVGGLGTE